MWTFHIKLEFFLQNFFLRYFPMVEWINSKFTLDFFIFNLPLRQNPTTIIWIPLKTFFWTLWRSHFVESGHSRQFTRKLIYFLLQSLKYTHAPSNVDGHFHFSTARYFSYNFINFVESYKFDYKFENYIVFYKFVIF